jgi:hypothetical protein
MRLRQLRKLRHRRKNQKPLLLLPSLLHRPRKKPLWLRRQQPSLSLQLRLWLRQLRKSQQRHPRLL